MASKSSSGPSVWELLLSKLHKNYKLLPTEQKRIYEAYSLPQPRYLAEETITLEDKRQIETIIETMSGVRFEKFYKDWRLQLKSG